METSSLFSIVLPDEAKSFIKEQDVFTICPREARASEASP